jgi:putative hydrolase of the HAD superfamily
MVLVFDLDDTLYEELDYVRSGFSVVAAMVEQRWGIPCQLFDRKLHEVLTIEGRGRVFDLALQHFGVSGRAAVQACLSAYRSHEPDIRLSQSAERALRRFKTMPLYVVTDGNALVQERKARALGLASRVRRVVVTHRFGRMRAKPSPHCFLRIAKWERVAVDQICYVGDNPTKDFVGIRPLGCRTIRVKTGPYAELEVPAMKDAEYSISTLDQLTRDLVCGM